jgi:universal stress protein E
VDLERILVAVAPGRSAQPALDKALVLAEASGATLELFLCEFDEAMEGSHFLQTERLQAAREERVDMRREWLEDHAGALRRRGLEIATDVVYENPRYESLARKAARSKASLLVVGTHDHPWSQRVLLGATEWQLIRVCPCPLLLARDLPWAEPPVILAAVDPGHRDDEHQALDKVILEAARGFARHGGQVHVLSCMPPLIDLTGAGAAGAMAPPMPDLDPATREAALAHRRRAVDSLLGAVGLTEARVEIAEANPVEALPRVAAELPADVLILGGVSRSRLAQVFVGGTAERLLDRMTCDLLVLRPPGFRSPVLD